MLHKPLEIDTCHKLIDKPDASLRGIVASSLAPHKVPANIGLEGSYVASIVHVFRWRTWLASGLEGSYVASMVKEEVPAADDQEIGKGKSGPGRGHKNGLSDKPFYGNSEQYLLSRLKPQGRPPKDREGDKPSSGTRLSYGSTNTDRILARLKNKEPDLAEITMMLGEDQNVTAQWQSVGLIRQNLRSIARLQAPALSPRARNGEEVGGDEPRPPIEHGLPITAMITGTVTATIPVVNTVVTMTGDGALGVG